MKLLNLITGQSIVLMFFISTLSVYSISAYSDEHQEGKMSSETERITPSSLKDSISKNVDEVRATLLDCKKNVDLMNHVFKAPIYNVPFTAAKSNARAFANELKNIMIDLGILDDDPEDPSIKYSTGDVWTGSLKLNFMPRPILKPELRSIPNDNPLLDKPLEFFSYLKHIMDTCNQYDIQAEQFIAFMNGLLDDPSVISPLELGFRDLPSPFDMPLEETLELFQSLRGLHGAIPPGIVYDHLTGGPAQNLFGYGGVEESFHGADEQGSSDDSMAESGSPLPSVALDPQSTLIEELTDLPEDSWITCRPYEDNSLVIRSHLPCYEIHPQTNIVFTYLPDLSDSRSNLGQTAIFTYLPDYAISDRENKKQEAVPPSYDRVQIRSLANGLSVLNCSSIQQGRRCLSDTLNNPTED